MSIIKENIKYHAFLFFISPLVALFYGIKTKSLNYIRWTIFVFTTLYGSLLTFALFGGEKGVDKGADGARHFNNVYIHYQYLDFSVWWDELIAILSFAPKYTTNDDIFIHLISYIVGTLFNSPGLFFVFVGAIYGYFFSGALYRFFKFINWKINYNQFFFYFFLIIFLLWKNVVDMQVVRFWTGVWVLIYAVLSYHETKYRKYLFLALSSPFFHIGLLALSIPIWIVLFSGLRNTKIYFIIFLLSIVTSNVIENTGILNFASQTELGESKVNSYYVDDERIERDANKKEEKLAQINFYTKYQYLRIHYYVLSAIIFIIYFIIKKNGFSRFQDTLFSYGLAMASFSNFFVSIFAIHNRGWEIAGIFILGLLLIFISKNNFNKIRFNFLKIKLPLFICILLLSPLLLYLISSFLNMSSAFILIVPFFSWINSDLGISIKDIIVVFL